MAEIRNFRILRHLRSDTTSHLIRFRRGRLTQSGRGLAFWFHPMSTSVAEIPIDDRELPFLYHGRSHDFQDVTIQGTIAFRVVDPEKLAQRVDFTIGLATGALLHQPHEKLGALVTELAQQFTWEYLTQTELASILESGFDAIRGRIEAGLAADRGILEMGIEIVSVRVGAIRPEPETEKALQIPVREAIQQRADQASFERRALAVEKERAIQENELQNQIELARREELLITQRGQNGRRQATETSEADQIETVARANRIGVEAQAEANRIERVEQAKVAAERDRMEIYRDFPAERLVALAVQKLAGKLERIEHVNITPDLFGGMLTQLVRAGTERLEAGEE